MLVLPDPSASCKLNAVWPEHGHVEALPVMYLVRHAHAGRKSEWVGSDLHRPLSPQGQLEALGLVDQLRDYIVERILCSPARRCLQTVEPLARRRGLRVEPSELLGVDGSGAGVLELLQDGTLGQAVLCTHGEVIGQVFEQLQAAGMELPARPRWPKGSTWVLDRPAHRWEGSYLPPRAPEPAAPGPLLR
jgi:phosphohistidine phosphatase SixA